MAVHAPSRLYRIRSGKMIAGVCGGLGEYFDVDPALMRLVFVITTLVSGVGLPAYILLWVILPREDDVTSRAEVLRGTLEDLYRAAREQLDPTDGHPGTAPRGGHQRGNFGQGNVRPRGSADPTATTGDDGVGGTSPPRWSRVDLRHAPPVGERRGRRYWAGAILMIVGLLMLQENLGLWWLQARLLWPLLLIGVGGWLVLGRTAAGR